MRYNGNKPGTQINYYSKEIISAIFRTAVLAELAAFTSL